MFLENGLMYVRSTAFAPDWREVPQRDCASCFLSLVPHERKQQNSSKRGNAGKTRSFIPVCPEEVHNLLILFDNYTLSFSNHVVSTDCWLRKTFLKKILIFLASELLFLTVLSFWIHTVPKLSASVFASRVQSTSLYMRQIFRWKHVDFLLSLGVLRPRISQTVLINLKYRNIGFHNSSSILPTSTLNKVSINSTALFEEDFWIEKSCFFPFNSKFDKPKLPKMTERRTIFCVETRNSPKLTTWLSAWKACSKVSCLFLASKIIIDFVAWVGTLTAKFAKRWKNFH